MATLPDVQAGKIHCAPIPAIKHAPMQAHRLSCEDFPKSRLKREKSLAPKAMAGSGLNHAVNNCNWLYYNIAQSAQRREHGHGGRAEGQTHDQAHTLDVQGVSQGKAREAKAGTVRRSIREGGLVEAVMQPGAGVSLAKPHEEIVPRILPMTTQQACMELARRRESERWQGRGKFEKLGDGQKNHSCGVFARNPKAPVEQAALKTNQDVGHQQQQNKPGFVGGHNGKTKPFCQGGWSRKAISQQTRAIETASSNSHVL